jgi:hypothetical protein
MLAAAQNMQGYGWWAFQWSGTEKIVWYEPASGAVRVGPAYLGLRDGWRDARLYSMAVKERKVIDASRAVSEGEGVLLRLGEVTQEVYHFKTITNLNSPTEINAARRSMLEALSAAK